MKQLEKNSIGKFKKINEKQLVFYKPEPNEKNRKKIIEVIGEEKWTTYRDNYNDKDEQYISAKQHFDYTKNKN